MYASGNDADLLTATAEDATTALAAAGLPRSAIGTASVAFASLERTAGEGPALLERGAGVTDALPGLVEGVLVDLPVLKGGLGVLTFLADTEAAAGEDGAAGAGMATGVVGTDLTRLTCLVRLAGVPFGMLLWATLAGVAATFFSAAAAAF